MLADSLMALHSLNLKLPFELCVLLIASTLFALLFNREGYCQRMIRQEACLANCRAQLLETVWGVGEAQLTQIDGWTFSTSGAARMTEREAETQIDRHRYAWFSG
jgi:hypothetical protein